MQSITENVKKLKSGNHQLERPAQFTYEDLRVKYIHSIKYKWNLRIQEELLNSSRRTIKIYFHAMSRPEIRLQLTKGTEDRKRHI